MLEFHPIADLFPLMQGDEYEALKADIAANGLRERIWLHPDGRILDGRNRYRACMELGAAWDYRTWDGKGSLVSFVVSLNLHRRHLSESQRAMIATKLATMPRGRQRANSSIDLFSQPEAAQMFNVSVPSVKRAKKIMDAGIPALQRSVVCNNIPVSVACEVAELSTEQQYKIVAAGPDAIRMAAKKQRNQKRRDERLKEKQEQVQRIAKAKEKIYNVILADPPWQYSNTGVIAAASKHYATMDTTTLCGFPKQINLQIADNSVLFLWVTNPLIEDAMRVIKEWGFKYKTNIVWVKTELQKPGTGFYVRGRHELLFICTKGSFTPLDPTASPPIGSVIQSPVREHSRKPKQVYDIIECLYPKCCYIELFARSWRDGWDSHGDEIGKFDE